jgi:hypothetical protein
VRKTFEEGISLLVEHVRDLFAGDGCAIGLIDIEGG